MFKCNDCGNTDEFRREFNGYVIAGAGDHHKLDSHPSINDMHEFEYNQGEGCICEECGSHDVEEIE